MIQSLSPCAPLMMSEKTSKPRPESSSSQTRLLGHPGAGAKKLNPTSCTPGVPCELCLSLLSSLMVTAAPAPQGVNHFA